MMLREVLAGLSKSDHSDDDRTSAVEDFRNRRSVVEASDDVDQLAFSVALAMHWKGFLSVHQSPTRFAVLPHEQQMDFFKQYQTYCQVCDAKQDEVTANAAYTLSHYLAAMIKKDRAFEVEVSQFLDAHAKRTWEIASSLA